MGPERRRRWRPEEKLALLGEAFAPGARVTEVARRRGVATSLIYQWRRQAMGPVGFVPAVLVDESDVRRAPPPASGAIIVVELAGGTRVTIGASAPDGLVASVLKALK